jgi:hypothetical protein
MGQYYLTVNPAKRQYLNPHKFGAGLKLMEFSGQDESIGQALLILCASGNGRGGGDLRSDDPLIGSWAGDPIVVAGDYMDAWLYVPDDLRGKEYTWEEQEMEDVPGKPGWKRATKRMIKRNGIFGKRVEKDGHNVDHDETLYSAALHFFEDISDQIMKVVALAESPYHPWAAVSKDDDGWRHIPYPGVLPDDVIQKPLAGKKAYKAYCEKAVPYGIWLTQNLAHFLRKHPEARPGIISTLQNTRQSEELTRM